MSAGNVGDLNACQSLLGQLPWGCQVTADRAYDAQWFRDKLAQRNIKANIAWRAFHVGKGKKEYRPAKAPPNPVTYRNRWLVERCFAWLEKFKRLVTRYERRAYLYKAFWQLACSMIILQRFSG